MRAADLAIGQHFLLDYGPRDEDTALAVVVAEPYAEGEDLSVPARVLDGRFAGDVHDFGFVLDSLIVDVDLANVPASYGTGGQA